MRPLSGEAVGTVVEAIAVATCHAIHDEAVASGAHADDPSARFTSTGDFYVTDARVWVQVTDAASFPWSGWVHLDGEGTWIANDLNELHDLMGGIRCA